MLLSLFNVGFQKHDDVKTFSSRVLLKVKVRRNSDPERKRLEEGIYSKLFDNDILECYVMRAPYTVVSIL